MRQHVKVYNTISRLSLENNLNLFLSTIAILTCLPVGSNNAMMMAVYKIQHSALAARGNEFMRVFGVKGNFSKWQFERRFFILNGSGRWRIYIRI